jgi:predicted AlkP superfamily phosphohydrolase/phosphomutase
MQKVAVIGLDGMPWHILHNLFKWNIMPNLSELTRKSIKGVLKSTIPPISATAWTSMATGVNPGKHGIFSFTRPTSDYADTRVLTSRDVKYLRVHEMVAVQNLKSVCINQLLTYPIKNFSGSYVITDWLSPEIEFSPEIKQYAKNYRGPTLYKLPPLLEKNWSAHYDEVSSRVDTVKTLLEKVDWNLFWVVYSEPDHLFHRYYDLVLKKDYRVMRLFTKIDETFKSAKEICDLIIVVSDHGFSKYNYGVYVNTFLEQLGLTKRVSQRTMKDIACHRQVGRPRMQIQLPENLYTYLAKLPSLIEFLLLKVYRQLLKANIRARLTTHIDPKSSKAFAYGFGIYVKEKELIDYVRSMLMKEHFIGGVWKKEELYSGKHVKDMPDLIVIPNFNAGFSFRGDVIAPKVVTRRDFSGHHPNGIVIIYTEGIKPSWTEKIKIYDIAPTLLDYLGLDKPEDMDGNVINLS